MSLFTDNLKKSLEEGTFNSPAANKINEILDKVDGVIVAAKANDITMDEVVNKRLEGNLAESVDEKTALEKNIEAEKFELQLKHETEMLRIKANIINTSDKIDREVKGLVETCKAHLLKLNKNDLDMREFLNSFVEKYEG